MKPNPEALEAIRMSNTAFWCLPMAHLSNKGNTRFECDLVMWTSNRFTFVFDSLTNPEAVQRRVDLKYRQKPAKEYGMYREINGQKYFVLDQAKVAREAQTDPTVYTRCIVFDKMKVCYNAEVALVKDMTLEQVMDEITELTLHKKRTGLAVNDAAREYFLKKVERPAEMHGAPIVVPNFQPNIWHRGPAQDDLDSEYEEDDIDREIDRAFDVEAARADSGRVEQEYPVDELMRARMVPPALGEDIAPVALQISDVPRPVPFPVKRSWRDIFMGNNFHINVRRTSAGRGQIALPEGGHATAGSPFRWASLATARCIRLAKVEDMCPQFTAVLRVARSQYLNAPPQHAELAFCTTFNRFYGNRSITDFLACEEHHCDEMDNPLWHEYVPIVGRAVHWFEEVWAVILKYLEQIWSRISESPVLSALFTGLLTAGTVMTVGGLMQTLVNRSAQQKRKPRRNVESAADKTIASQRVPVESASDKTLSAARVPVESAADKTIAAPRVAIESKVIRLEDDNVEAVYEQNSYEIAKITARNIYVLEKCVDGEWKHVMNLVVLGGRIALVNRHLFLHKEGQWRIRNCFFQGGYEFRLDECAAAFPDADGKHSMKDSALIELPRTVHLHKNILPYFMKSEDFERHRALLSGAYQGCSLLRYKKGQDFPMLVYSTTSNVHAADSDKVFDLTKGDRVVGRIRDFYMHMVPTVKGDCGALFMAIDKNFDRKIIGIHAAGALPPYTGVVTPTSQEFLLHLMSKLQVANKESVIGTNLQCDHDIEIEVDEEDVVSFPGVFEDFMPCGSMDTPLHANRKTRIVPSPVHGKIREPITKPAYLRPVMVDGKLVDPEEKGRNKAAGCCQPLDKYVLGAACLDFRQLVLKNIEPRHREVLTFEEALMGREGDDFIEPLNRQTSPGYGWAKIGAGKTHYLGRGEWKLDHPEVLERYASMKATCVRGERPCVFWSDTLKDERRPIEKVNQGKTRLFSAGEMIFTILFRQYFAGFCAHLARNRITMESCVGVNPYSKDWDFLARRLQQVGPHVIAGDFTNYDGTLHPEIVWALLDEIIEPFYEGSDEDRLIRRAIWCEIVNSIHITGRKVYMWTHGQPSGCPATAIINSCVHSITARMVWLMCARKWRPDMATLLHYAKHVRHNNYGDDDVWNISSEVLDWFNQDSVSWAYAQIGMTYTDEGKTGETVTSRFLSEVRFLKRAFVWDSEAVRFRAPLTLDTIYEMPMWTRGLIDQMEVTGTTLRQAAYEAAQYNRVEFAEIIAQLEPARKIVNEFVDCHFLTYDQYQEVEWDRYVAGLV